MGLSFIITALDEKIQYITVKLIEKQINGASNVVGGLFKGIVKHKDKSNKEHTFILTEQKNKNNKSIINGLNIEYYDILSISLINDKYEVNVFTTKDIKNQKKMYNILRICLKTLKVKNMVLKNENYLINTDLYTKIPETIVKKKATTFYPHNSTGTHSQGIYNQKKIPQPIFSNSKDINTQEIEKMKLKLDLILTNSFKYVLPETMEGEEEKIVPTHNYYSGMGYGY